MLVLVTTMSSQNANDVAESIRQYEAQLQQINLALSCTEPGEDRDSLLSLQADLQQLISLTGESLKDYTNSCEKSAQDDDPFAAEYALFKAELEGEEQSSKPQESAAPTETSESSIYIPENLEELQGSKCQAPFMHTWGESYHNALVFNIVPCEEVTSINQIQVRVMFTNPTHAQMLPCPYYLEGECRFTDERCRFSHGEIVKLSSLRVYKEPDFSKVRENSFVLARYQKDNLWHRGTVLAKKDVDTWMVKLESVGGGIVEVNLKDILPMDNNEDDQESDFEDDDNSDNDDNNEDDNEGSDKNEEVNESCNLRVLQAPPSDELGSWEKYTRGIGSRLMERMGYIKGTGLGLRGEGRVDPVKAVIVPAGKSLDHCMNIRERKEQGLDPTKKRRRFRPRRGTDGQFPESTKMRSNVFDFLNNKLGDKPTTSTDNQSVLKGKSNQNLNVASLQVAEEIRKAEKDLVHLKQCLHRQAPGSKSHAHMLAKLSSKQDEIGRLQQSEKKIEAEQGRRKNHKKLAVF